MHELQDQIILTEQLHTLEMQNMNIRLILAEKELALMQSMFNPHFLYNTLSVVSSLAVLEKAPRTQETAIKIARYLRSSMNRVGTHVTIRDELDLLRQYVYIQSLRFNDRITVLLRCAPACEEAVVPALLLQPLVENAYVHGLRDCTRNGLIQVVIQSAPDSRVLFEISDNGSGISPEQLEALRASLHNPAENRPASFGILGVVFQLQVMFGTQYEFQLDSTPGQGTTLRMLLPFRRETAPREDAE